MEFFLDHQFLLFVLLPVWFLMTIMAELEFKKFLATRDRKQAEKFAKLMTTISKVTPLTEADMFLFAWKIAEQGLCSLECCPMGCECEDCLGCD